MIRLAVFETTTMKRHLQETQENITDTSQKHPSKPDRRYLYLGIVVLFAAVIGYVGLVVTDRTPENKKSGKFSTETTGLPDASDMAEVVNLRDGDTYDLEAHYVVKTIGNRNVRMIGYNGSVPGPFLHVDQGATITIAFTNNLDIETTIHSHGLRLDYLNDGTPGLSQTPIQPGETYVYTLTFPDAGTYWYHPHVREDYAQELGMYSNYQVRPVDYDLPKVNETVNLIVDDILFERDDISPFYKDMTNFAVMGRYGNVMLVNGMTDYAQSFSAGSVVRLNITNTANVRPFELSIPGASMKLIGSDVSPYEREMMIDTLLITPAERYIVDVYFPDPGAYTLTHTSHDLSAGSKQYTMATFTVTGDRVEETYVEEFRQLHTYPTVTDSMDGYDAYLYKKPDKSIRLTLTTGSIDLGSAMSRMPCHRMPDGEWMGECTDEKKQAWLSGLAQSGSTVGGEEIHWEDHMFDVNRKATTRDIRWIIRDEQTGKENEAIDDWNFSIGDLVKVRIFNDPMSDHPMQHPIHFHGQRFVVLSRNGVPETNRVWKDTTLAKVGETVDILVEMSNPGAWMTHCHIAEHLSAGMMFSFTVGEGYHTEMNHN